jgi:beta-lactamase superfamily II metal-dependent hydrolase
VAMLFDSGSNTEVEHTEIASPPGGSCDSDRHRATRHALGIRGRRRARFTRTVCAVSCDTGDDVNENSTVTMLHYHAFRELFMGDAGEANVERLLSAGDNLQADVVKIGHHGSAYASTSSFALHVRPAYAIISVGRHNMFGHPAPTTIQTWKRTGARVLRTDECGAVTIRVKEESHSMDACEVLRR